MARTSNYALTWKRCTSLLSFFSLAASLSINFSSSSSGRSLRELSSVELFSQNGSENFVEFGDLSRREAWKRISASVVAPYLLLGGLSINPISANAILNPYTDEKQTIVITGSNSGIGLDAATRMASKGHKIILACRTISKAETAARAIQESLSQSNSVGKDADLVPMECDLASLKSISNFVSKLKASVLGENGQIDILALNAGLARDTNAKEVLRTQEGFELTVGTNHLGHFYLTQLALPLVQNNGRIVVTASSVHDPDSPGGAQGSKATLGNLEGLENGPYFDMVDGGPFDADKAYKDSKLCNVFFTQELQRRLESAGSQIVANCFTPGLIVGTGLFRDQNPIFTKVFDFAATSLLRVGETPQYGGGALEYMCLDKNAGSKGGRYFFSDPGSSKYGEAAYGAQFNVAEVSKEARNTEKGKRLWDLSMKLVGYKT